MKILVIGCGSVGQRHIKNLISLSAGEIVVCDLSLEKCQFIEKEFSLKTFTNIEKALDQNISAVLICTPSSLHIPQALLAAERGCHIFIEKPLSNSLSKVDELISTVREKHLVTLVGCNTRFLPSMKFVKDLVDKGEIGRILSARASCGFYLPYWHPWEDYRKGYTANTSLGGGIILDDIHEIDYLRWLLNDNVKEVFCYLNKISDLEMDTEDIASVLLKFNSGVIAEAHFDCLQHTYRRSLELIGGRGIILWDYIKDTVRLFTEKKKKWQLFSKSIRADRNDMFVAEMNHFINCIEGKEISQNDLVEAKHVLEIALAAKESNRLKKIISL